MTGLLLLKDSFALNQRKNISEFNKKMRYQLMKKSYKCRYPIVDLIEMLFHSQTTDDGEREARSTSQTFLK